MGACTTFEGLPAFGHGIHIVPVPWQSGWGLVSDQLYCAKATGKAAISRRRKWRLHIQVVLENLHAIDLQPFLTSLTSAACDGMEAVDAAVDLDAATDILSVVWKSTSISVVLVGHFSGDGRNSSAGKHAIRSRKRADREECKTLNKVEGRDSGAS